jgi:hypothetical protein
MAVDPNEHVLRLVLNKRLRCEDMLDLRRANPVCQRAESTMCRGVAVPADDRHAGEREALFGSDHVHDPLALIPLGIILDTEVLGVLGYAST